MGLRTARSEARWRRAQERNEAELGRLRRLGVRFVVLEEAAARERILRFVDEYLDPDRAQLALDAVTRGEPLAFERWIRDECHRAPSGRSAPLEWLGGGTCLRLARHVDLPALEVDLATMNPAWATSWPGAYVHFDLGRALVVTLDYEPRLYDLAPPSRTAYR